MTHQLYRGKILVATPALDSDKMFRQSVVFIYEEKDETIFGLVLNKPSKLTIADACRLTKFQHEHSLIDNQQKLYTGGPVGQESLVLLHSNEWQSTNTHQVAHNLAVSSDKLMIEKLLMGNVPKDYKLLSGVSTWHPRQLAMEIHYGSWLQISTPDPHMFFTKEGKAGWMDCIKKVSSEQVESYL